MGASLSLTWLCPFIDTPYTHTPFPLCSISDQLRPHYLSLFPPATSEWSLRGKASQTAT